MRSRRYYNPDKISNYLETVQRQIDQRVGEPIKVSTALNYSQFIDKYLSYMGMDTEGLEDFAQEGNIPKIAKSIDEWLYQLKGIVVKELKPTTKAIAAMAVKSYFDVVYYISFDYKRIRHARRVLGKAKAFDPGIFTTHEVEAVMAARNSTKHEDLADMIVIGWNCIARRSEVVQLTVDDVKPDAPYITIRGLKGSRDYTFKTSDPVDDELWEAVRHRCMVAEDAGSHYLFPSGDGHVHPTTFSVWFGRDLCRKLFGQWRSIHAFCRHTRITQMFEEGYPAAEIQGLARHKFLETTQLYNKSDILRRLES